jgi:DNA modification methylase/ParB-like chromosome segregation protein Spo0J
MPTNLLPDLTTWEYDALKESIRRWKVILPVIKDENGDIIDGHQRVRICEELGITDYPVLTLGGLSEDEKRDHAFVLNLLRRRLNQQQMRDLIAAELKRKCDLSDNWLAQILGCTDKTVAAVREELIATSEIPKLDVLRGKDGKCRRVTRIVTTTAKEAERAQEALQILGDEAPCRDLELRLAERRANRKQKLEMTNGRQVQPPEDGDIKVYHCPFQTLEEVAEIEPNSVNLVLTDIPYGQEFLPQVAELGAFANRVLVPGGFLATYAGKYWLPKVLAAFEPYLQYRWCLASVWEGSGNVIHPGGWKQRKGRVISKWKPILLYSKGDWAKEGEFFDVVMHIEKEKDWHDWQQPLAVVETLVRYFSDLGDLVVDPCGGGFTTAVACKRLGRRCISCDIDEAAVIRGQDRLAGKTPVPVG